MADVSYAVDVSGNQEAHQPWKGFGVHMGIAKATEGQHTRDAWFARHITDIKAAGLVPGAYHFAWPNQDVATEAANYIGAVRDHTVPLFVHALDLERYPNGARNYLGATSAQVRQYAHDWMAAVKAAFPGQKVGIYTSGDDILDGHLPGNEDFLWYPKYPVQGRTFAQAAAAVRPAPSGHTVWGWQFASVPRDQTVIYMSPAALAAWAAGTTAHVQEDDMPLTAKDVELLLDTEFDDPTKPGAAKVTVRGALWAAYGQAAAANAAAQKSAAQVGGLTGVLTQLLAAVKTGSTLTPAQATAAAEAGAKAALAELGNALTH